MTNKLAVFITVPLLLYSLLCCRAGKPIATPFNRISTTTGDNRAGNSLQVLLKADTVQKRSEKGLQFSLRLQNDSASSVTIKNPMDLFSPSLLNEAGKDILYPYISRLLIHSRGPNTNKSFVVNRLKINDRTGDEKLLQQPQVTIPGNGSIEIFISITHVLKPDAVKPYTAEQTMPIPSGRYQLLSTLAMMEGEKSSLLRIPSVYIRYQ
ncbi:hypothetical protein HB364_29565 [Pseudoflavitalea sp. X16]|uniref:hypothetical protein n=1 Tax=Paraflavitalea devenefica TaxID=2716334 RepID=UPI0014236047|nr:hypothetical protein [Paraflavitalea devenefica]NII29264.1 hypothetical protein [Paraflavitalea devenefica]